MKPILFATAALAAAGASAVFADSLNSGVATGTASVIVYTPLTIVQNQGLDFGTVTSGATGAVSINADNGVRSVSGGVGAVGVDVGKAGAFTVAGQPNAAINVLVGTAITGFPAGLSGSTVVGALPTVLTGRSADFAVGGALNVGAETPPGTYQGSFSVAVNYP